MDIGIGLPAAIPWADARALAALAPVALAVAVAGCGGSSGTRIPDVRKLPLVDGARAVAQSRVCDRGASAYCALELVVVDPRYATSAALVSAEHAQLKRHGWTGANGDTGDERAADSPGGKLRVTYATAYGELKGIDLGWVKRSRTTALTLSHLFFRGVSAMSILLEVGSS
jgi:hypothetical protein